MSAMTAEQVTICQICGIAMRNGEASHTCEECNSKFHDNCWNFIGGCATYGCPNMYETKKSEGDLVSYWGTFKKKCPICAETIAVSELKCPYCGTDFDDVRPVSREDFLRPNEEPPNPLRKTALRMLILSALGVTSPLVLIGGSIWYIRHRREIAEQDFTTRALTAIALGVATVYMLLIGAGMVAFGLMSLVTGDVQ